MSLLLINERTCNKDGVCVTECPAHIIHLKDGTGFPEMVPGGEAICITCGHCVAVCPKHALSHARVSIEDCLPIEKALVIDEKQAVQFLRSRRSIRVYKDKPVETKKIQRLIEIARYAPTGSNTQLVKWVVFNGQEKVKRLAGFVADWMRDILEHDPDNAPFPKLHLSLYLAAWDAGFDGILRSAPAVVVAMAPQEAGNGIVDPTIALAYLDLAAPTLGIGTCWAGLLCRAAKTWPPLQEAIGISEAYPYFYPLMLGYPQFAYRRLPERKPPKIEWK
jgi:nitroreductase/NAD-dependent dihydropyrimidine dehydrogenase PreA subunit